MSSTGQVSVRAMKGKFEQLQDVPLATSSSSAYRRRRTPFSTIDPSPQVDSFLLSPDEDSTMFPGEDNIVKSNGERDSRFRSQSVGNPWESRRNGNNESNSKRSNRNQSFNKEHNGRFQNQFSSFTEKQRLVESIVMNIKNSDHLKKEEVNQKRNKEEKHKETLTITSKLEKDIKNALEKGVRKWNNKNARDKYFNEGFLETPEKKCINKFENISKEPIPVHQKRSFSKINAILGVDLYPVRSFLSNEAVQSHSDNSYVDFRDEIDSYFPLSKSGSSPVMFRSYDRYAANENRESEVGNVNEFKTCHKSLQHIFPMGHHQETSIGSLVENTHDLTVSIHDSMTSASELPERASPVRPPRKRSPRKKSRAPMPPQHVDQKEEHNVVSMKDELNNSEQDGFNEANEIKEYNNNNFISNKTTPVVSAEPPKKPPRTFAYDIYRNLKNPQDGFPPDDSRMRGTSLSPTEIESLYTKPLKRLQERQAVTLRPPIRSKSDLCKKLLPKPAIAPKPVDIITKAKKRFSVAEPIVSVPNEYNDSKTSVKRNTSFRFSFRKSKKSNPGRQASPSKDNQMGQRLKMVAKNWHQKRDESDMRSQFHRRSKSDDFLNQDIDSPDEYDPIYAVPNNREVKPKETKQELHYMCSPLFLDGSQSRMKYEEDMKENMVPPGRIEDTRGRFGLMDGLKQEWRQSCRFVQKRLRSASHGDRKA